MKDRRRFLQVGLSSLGLSMLGSADAPVAFGIKTVYEKDLPSVSLDGWRVTALELTYPPGMTSPKHLHPGFILGYVVEGRFRFQVEGQSETVLSTGDVFYEAPAASTCPRAAPAQRGQREYWRGHSAKKERR